MDGKQPARVFLLIGVGLDRKTRAVALQKA